MTKKGNMYKEKKVLKELKSNLAEVEWDEVYDLIDRIQRANKIFLTGAGRVGLCAESFAMRLAHLGNNAFVLGDATTPSGSDGDILISCSAGGTSVTTVALSRKAQKEGLELIVISANRNSNLWSLADRTFYLPGPTRGNWGEQNSLQPLGTIFEQSLFIFFDIVVLNYMEQFSISERELETKHCNIE